MHLTKVIAVQIKMSFSNKLGGLFIGPLHIFLGARNLWNVAPIRVMYNGWQPGVSESKAAVKFPHF